MNFNHSFVPLMICQFCEYEFPDGLGKYGCIRPAECLKLYEHGKKSIRMQHDR